MIDMSAFLYQSWFINMTVVCALLDHLVYVQLRPEHF